MSLTKPKPVTTTHSPNVGLIKRTPYNAIAAITVKAAESSSTLSGTCAHRFWNTNNLSMVPLEITLVPTQILFHHFQVQYLRCNIQELRVDQALTLA